MYQSQPSSRERIHLLAPFLGTRQSEIVSFRFLTSSAGCKNRLSQLAILQYQLPKHFVATSCCVAIRRCNFVYSLSDFSHYHLENTEFFLKNLKILGGASLYKLWISSCALGNPETVCTHIHRESFPHLALKEDWAVGGQFVRHYAILLALIFHMLSLFLNFSAAKWAPRFPHTLPKTVLLLIIHFSLSS